MQSGSEAAARRLDYQSGKPQSGSEAAASREPISESGDKEVIFLSDAELEEASMRFGFPIGRIALHWWRDDDLGGYWYMPKKKED
jgi:hypothetical protein